MEQAPTIAGPLTNPIVQLCLQQMRLESSLRHPTIRADIGGDASFRTWCPRGRSRVEGHGVEARAELSKHLSQTMSVFATIAQEGRPSHNQGVSASSGT